MPQPFGVLVLCTANSGGRLIAVANLAARGAGRISAASAGSRPAAAVNPHAVDVLRRHGIPWTGRKPKGLDSVRGERFDLLITVCDGAAEDCPFFAGARARVHWGLPDPAAEREPEAARRAFDRTYAQLAARIDGLLAIPLESVDPTELERAARGVHQSLGRDEGARGVEAPD
jgi:arsenate reductase